MGEVRVISAVESAKIKAGNELPKPRALVVVQWIGFFGVGALLLRLIWIGVSSLAAAFGEDYTKVDLGALLFESVYLIIAQGLFLGPFLAMVFGLKGSRYFVPIFCTLGAMIACGNTTVPLIVSVMGFVPPVAIWVFPSIRKWYKSLV